MNINQGALVGQRLGKYELLALLAIGGTAEIYLARIDGEAGFEKYVVVKCLLDHLADEPDYVKMFLDEARLGAQLDNSNIVQTLELGEKDGRYYMAMEYLSGMSLAQLARKTNQRVAGGRIPPELVLGLAAQACSGLHYAHRKLTTSGKPLNLVHRDISPQNLVVSFEGILKIVDFGIAKADVRDTHTRSGTIKGKFAYMSPEQCLAKTVDHRTDIFALGVILHELLTARRLFKRTTTYETYEAIIKGKVPKPSEVAPDLGTSFDDVVMRALQYRKEDRWESAEMLGQALLGTLHKRGKSVNASDIANFYEMHFQQELKEYGDRMRLLITGKAEAAIGEESVNWGEEIDGSQPEEESEIAIELDDSMVESVEALAAQGAMPPLDAPATIERMEQLGEIVEVDEPGDTIEPDEPVGATRVEANPMALLEQQAGGSPTIDIDATHIQPETTTPNPKPAGPGGRTIAPGGVAPLPRASEVLRSKGQTAGPSAKTIAPGQLMAGRPATASPSSPAGAKTIGPGQLRARPSTARPEPPKLPDMSAQPKGQGKKPSRGRPTLNLKGGSAEVSGATGDKSTPPKEEPRKTVMGVSAQSPVGPRARASTTSSPSARTLYQSPPAKDPQPPASPPAGTPARGGIAEANRGPTSNAGLGPAHGRPGTAANPDGQVPPDTLPPNAQPPHGAGPGPRNPRSSTGGPQHQRGPSLHAQSAPRVAPSSSLGSEPWFIGLVFIISLGVGLGATLLFASL